MISRLRAYSDLFVVLGWCLGISSGLGTFGFDFHHRFSDPVKEILAVDGLPAKGSVDYFNAMAHRDRMIHGRRLAQASVQTPVTFLGGNATYRLNSLGYLHYANVSVGTPALSFLVALDTGSDLFWLPCDCSSCVNGLRTSRGEVDFNIYSPGTSTTSSEVLCKSTICEQQRHCPSAQSVCPYQVLYLSNGTSSAGFLVDDVLHLVTDDTHPKAVEAKITFGCGQVQTGSFLDGAAPNGLFGLGMDNLSVPSILARGKVATNSFSMCFAPDGLGRIKFGDRGSSDQGETTFNLRKSHPTYNISLTQISVGGKVGNIDFSVIFDSGTSFTYLNDPAYTLISESFNKLALDNRYTSTSDLPFEYCYEISRNQGSLKYPVVNLTMRGGDQFSVKDPIVLVPVEDGDVYCLGVVRSNDVNIIGQNFMTGYRIVYDRERMVLGWKASKCNDIETSNTLPVKPPTAVTPAVAVDPEATAENRNDSRISGAPPPLMNHSPQRSSFPYLLLIALLPSFALI